VELSDADQKFILMALRQMKHAKGKLNAARTDLSLDSVG
jgi:hypothetical protein